MVNNKKLILKFIYNIFMLYEFDLVIPCQR